MLVIRSCLALTVACVVPAWAATVLEERLAAAEASVPADELADPGNPARAQALAAIDSAGLSSDDLIALRLAQIAAWIDARDVVQSENTIAALPRDLAPAQRERLDLLRIARWQMLHQQGGDAGDPLALVADGSPRVRARALAVRAQDAITASGPGAQTTRAGAMADLDQALALLRDVPPDERLPLLRLRLTAMEATGADPAQVDAWLASRADDPAAQQIQRDRTPPTAQPNAAPDQPPAADDPP